MPPEKTPDLNLFYGILHTLEAIAAPHMIIGAFAATVYGITRVTNDIDIVVDVHEELIEQLTAAYPPPRYDANPQQMRDSIRLGIMFNIIDTSRGEKADLIPLTMDSRYMQALQRRVRQLVESPNLPDLEIWCARFEDVILGKLMALAERRSHKHEVDIHEMLVAHYLDITPPQTRTFDETAIAAQARDLGADVVEFWQTTKASALQEAGRIKRSR